MTVVETAEALRKHLGASAVRCEVSARQRFHNFKFKREFLGTCYLGAEDVNGWLVRRGWAVGPAGADPNRHAYASELRAARAERLGMWSDRNRKLDAHARAKMARRQRFWTWEQDQTISYFWWPLVEQRQ